MKLSRILGLALAFTVVSLSTAVHAAAFNAAAFDVAPSTTQSAGHPNVRVALVRSGGDNEDIKNVVVDLPPGLIANPEAAKYKCSSFYFSIDLCSKESQVGVISSDVTALGLLPMTVSGDVEVLTPNSSDAATLGYVLRPIGSSIGILSKVFLKNSVTVNSLTDFGLRNTHLNIPTTTKAVVGLIPVPITIEAMDMTFHARANQYQSGKYFMLNPSGCTPATSTLVMTSYQLVTVTRTSTFTPTGCGSTPFAPSITSTYSNLNAEKSTGTTVTLAQSTDDMAIQNSSFKKAVITYPQGSGLDFDVLDALTGCTQSQFTANSCPAGSQIGTASAAVPALPPSFSGRIFALDPIGSTLKFGVLLSGPRGVRAYVYGDARVLGVGPSQRVVATVDNAPPFPVKNFKLTFTSPLITNPASCGAQNVIAELTAHSGADSTLTNSYTTVNCAPETEITAAPASPSNDASPTFSFSASPPAGATFQCAYDSGPWSSCASGAEMPSLGEGQHLVRVRACNAIGNCDHTPAEYALEIDLTPPSGRIISPVADEVVRTRDVALVFEREPISISRCRVDNQPWRSCSPPSELFTDLADGPHTLEVEVEDAAGNITHASVAFVVDPECVPGEPGCEFVAVFDDGDNTQSVSPRGGLAITDLTPTFSFHSEPANSPSYECSIDGGAYFACASPFTTPTLNVFESHTFAVRAPGQTSPTVAEFFIDFFAPGVDIYYLDNQDNSITDTKAAGHPDVEATFYNPAGDPVVGRASLPDGAWGSLGAAEQCVLTDVSAGACGADSKVGTVELKAVNNANEEHTFTSDVYLTESPGGSIAGLAANMHIAYDGKDYGHIRDDALFEFNARYVRSNPAHANVHDPRGMDAKADSLPFNTANHPGPDGPVVIHVRELRVHLDGDTGLDVGKPLITAPSNCEATEAVGYMTDSENNDAEIPVPYQATDCDTVPFEPALTQSYSPVTKGADTVVTAVASLADENSTIRRLVLDLPVSIQPQFAGLADSCLPSDTRLIPPACDTATTKVGSVSIDTPLLPNPISGDVFLEESGNPLPNLYIYAVIPELGLDVRLRGATETVGDPSHLQFKLNAEQNGALSDVPDIPVRTLTMTLPGGANGPVVRVSTGCRAVDTTSSGQFTGWSGASRTVNQTIVFDPACPN